jgi:hypothetical protein
VLTQPMADAPRTTFNYNGGNPYLLSALINKKFGGLSTRRVSRTAKLAFSFHRMTWRG